MLGVRNNRIYRAFCAQRGGRKKRESAYKPGSVVNSHSSGMCVTTHLKQPTRKHARAALNAFLFGLAPGGVYRAAECCHRRGALLPHLFTLTCAG